MQQGGTCCDTPSPPKEKLWKKVFKALTLP